MHRIAVVLLFVGLVGGCGVHLPGPVGPVAPLPEHRLTLRFSSRVPAVYYVFSGPADSYRPFRVNDRLREALETYVRRKSAAAATKEAELNLELLSVTTDYRQIGVGLGRSGPRPASLDRVMEGDFSAPAEITKTVFIAFRLEIRAAGATLRSETARAEATEVIDRDHFDRWSYDYSDVMGDALRKVVAAVDRALEETLGAAAGTRPT